MREPRQPRYGGDLRRHLRAWRLRLQQGRQGRRARSAAARLLYDEMVDQARTERFFAELGVPDTPEGRFEMIALHAALLMRRLRAEGVAGRALSQALFDLMFADMDAALRELGVGDLSVGKQVKRLAGQFYARLAGLDAALDRGVPEALGPVLHPVYHGAPAPAPSQVEALAGHLIALERRLGALPGAALLRGEADFTASAS